MRTEEYGNQVAIPNWQEDHYDVATEYLLCPICGREIPDEDWEDGDHSIVKGNVYCHDCVKEATSWQDYVDFVKEKNMEKDFIDYANGTEFFNIIIPYVFYNTDEPHIKHPNTELLDARRKKLFEFFENYCYEDADEFVEWIVKRKDL